MWYISEVLSYYHYELAFLEILLTVFFLDLLLTFFLPIYYWLLFIFFFLGCDVFICSTSTWSLQSEAEVRDYWFSGRKRFAVFIDKTFLSHIFKFQQHLQSFDQESCDEI